MLDLNLAFYYFLFVPCGFFSASPPFLPPLGLPECFLEFHFNLYWLFTLTSFVVYSGCVGIRTCILNFSKYHTTGPLNTISHFHCIIVICIAAIFIMHTIGQYDFFVYFIYSLMHFFKNKGKLGLVFTHLFSIFDVLLSSWRFKFPPNTNLSTGRASFSTSYSTGLLIINIQL